MKIKDLPIGTAPEPMALPHFPSRQQAVIWRNWGLVPPETLAQVLKCSVADVVELAAGLSLSVDPASQYALWRRRGYITIIRRNWHLLPYEQLLKLLDWTPEKLAFILKEDDFLWHKLGGLKPQCAPVIYEQLSRKQKLETAILRQILATHFADESATVAPPFTFLEHYGDGQIAESTTAGVPVTKFKFGMRLAYSYSAVYGDPLLDQELDPYPDNLLSAYAAEGINAVWLPGILYTLTPWLGENRYSAGWQHRLDNLRRLARRAAAHGIGLYLYLNEPRNMPKVFFRTKPDWRGAESLATGNCALCTSAKGVLEALSDSLTMLFEQVPELGGAFTITMSENLTHCRSKNNLVKACPRCAGRDIAEFSAEVNRAIAEGIHRAKPEADVIAWSWGWAPEWAERAVAALPDDVKLMCVSETAVPTTTMGIRGEVDDYVISRPGPGPIAFKLWKKAAERGLSCIAKIQLNNTWECSAVPYLPVPNLIKRHLDNLSRAGVADLMVSWTLGGWPSGNFDLPDKSIEQIAMERFGVTAAPAIIAAWTKFSAALEELPLHGTAFLYSGPQNYGPMNLLFMEKSGYVATMLGFPYDDLASWRGHYYPEDVFEKQFEKLSVLWAAGLERLTAAGTQVSPKHKPAFSDLANVATAAYCHFRSVYLQIRFIRLRNSKNNQMISNVLDEEITIAKRLLEVIKRDSRIGFESSNHYFYTVNDLKEKILNCETLKKLLGKAA